MQNGKMQNGKFELITTCGNARRGRMHTVHGEIETPVFMNVGTAAAIRGGAGTDDLRRIADRDCGARRVLRHDLSCLCPSALVLLPAAGTLF